MSDKRKNNYPGNREMRVSHRQVAVSAEYHHSGPIPDPMTLEKYNQVLPGAAERILRMAELQSEHRRSIEMKAVNANIRNSMAGIISGTVVTLVTLAAGTFTIVQGYAWSGTFIGSAGLVGLAGVFIYGTKSSRKERENKR